MKTTDTTEKGFQKLIVKELIEKQGYIETNSNEFDQEFCINKAGLLAFIKASQPVNHDVIRKKGIRPFLSRIDSKIKKEGIVEVLRKGVKHFDKTIYLYPIHSIMFWQRFRPKSN